MREAVYDSILRLIDDYRLHQWMLVKLAPLEALFPVRHADLDVFRIAGSCIPPPDGLISPATPARVVLDCGLDDYSARIVYAHEIGHALAGHAGELMTIALDAWFGDKAEREAWEVAALLLVPYDAISRYQDLYVIALMCEVPEHLVSLAVQCYLGSPVLTQHDHC